MAYSSPLWESPHFLLFHDRIVQNDYQAIAVSEQEINSNYHSPKFAATHPVLDFKFSINGKDNEMPIGIHHRAVCLEEFCETPVIEFGSPYADDQPVPEGALLQPDTKIKIRVSLKKVFEEFEKQGYFTDFHGNKIYQEDFKALYVAGNIIPLEWDFDDLVYHPEFELKDWEGNHIYEIQLTLNPKNLDKKEKLHWVLSRDISSFPQFNSGFLLLDAVYNLSLEELLKDIEEDQTFRTGEEWPGVWTRDISYSIILSLAILKPDVSKNSLLRKVQNGRIVQDTGTGGAYPVSTDRVIWAAAAWELYLVTGDREWLAQSYEIIKNTVNDDLHNVFDESTGLVKGESSFLDWREQTYPDWMEPADIFNSECLGTNAVHFQALWVLSKMAKELNLGDESAHFETLAESVKNGINKFLWIEEKGYYGQYLYGRYSKLLSYRSETLGEALCILFGIADRRQEKMIVENMPVVPYGSPCIYPQIPDVPPYHNNGIWPFVQSYWAWASAKAGNSASLMNSLCALYRAAALYLTNKENMVAENGDYAGTEKNSGTMLWSIAGNLSIVYKMFFGMQHTPASLKFDPFVPKALEGNMKLAGFKYRDATLDLELKGFGNNIKSFFLDGQEFETAEIPGDLSGYHQVEIMLQEGATSESNFNLVENRFSLATPFVKKTGNWLIWNAVEGAQDYMILKNGVEFKTTKETHFAHEGLAVATYQVIASQAEGYDSYASEPVRFYPEDEVKIFEIEKYAYMNPPHHVGYSGDGFVEISRYGNTRIEIPVSVEEPGFYFIDFQYANGQGPVNTDNKCAIRTLRKNGQYIGVVVFPQRGKGEWSNWGFSNAVKVWLDQGEQLISINFEPQNENMDREVNHAFLDFMRVVKIGNG